jgi:translocation and assembly module TamB
LTEAAALPAPLPGLTPKRRLWRWPILVALIVLAAPFLALLLLDSDAGHRLIVDRIAAIEPKNGLRIRIGRIDGSIYGRARLRNVRLADPKGVFLSAPDVRIDWAPAAWLTNRLHVRSLTAQTATLHRLPELRRTGQPFRLPSFDIRVGELRIDRLRIARGVAGPERTGSLRLKADISDGRALIDGAARTSAGDRLTLKLDAAPERDRFDLAAQLQAPVGGLFGTLIGTARPLAAQVAGRGSWRDWAGTARMDASSARVADLALSNRAGDWRLTGG